MSLSRKPLQFEDMWKLPPQDRVANLAERFEDVWAKEQQKAKPSLVCDHTLPPRLIGQDADGLTCGKTAGRSDMNIHV